MLEIGTSGLMSGERKRVTACRPQTAPFFDSTQKSHPTHCNQITSPKKNEPTAPHP